MRFENELGYGAGDPNQVITRGQVAGSAAVAVGIAVASCLAMAQPAEIVVARECFAASSQEKFAAANVGEEATCGIGLALGGSSVTREGNCESSRHHV